MRLKRSFFAFLLVALAVVQASAARIFVNCPEGVSNITVSNAVSGDDIVINGVTWHVYSTDDGVETITVNGTQNGGNYTTGTLTNDDSDCANYFVRITGIQTPHSTQAAGTWSVERGVPLTETYFPDANLRAAIAVKTEVSEGSVLTDEVLHYNDYWYTEDWWEPEYADEWDSDWGENDLSGMNISSLTGMEYFNVTGLYAFYNNITSFNPASFPNLEELYLLNNPLTELDLSQCPQISDLNVTGNLLTELDVTNLTNLESLNCSNNQLTGLDLSHCPNISDLDVTGNLLTELDVTNLTNLSYLTCSNNQLTGLDVTSLTYLKSLDCSYNQLTELDLSHNTNLSSLDCSHNQFSELDLSHNTRLSSLDCSNNQLTELDLSHNTELYSLNCSNNQFSELDLSQTPWIQFLTVDGNQFTNLDFTKNLTELNMLSVGSNPLPSTLDISGYPNLHWFICDSTQISTLNVSNCPRLYTVECKACQLTSVNCEETHVGSLILTSNKLESIDVSHLTNLTELRVDMNNLTSIDLTNNTRLATLSLNHNNLTSLDVSHLTDLETLTGGHNQLTYLNVTGLSNLTHLCIGFNRLKEVTGLASCVGLGQLYVNDNDLYTLDVSALSELTTLHAQNNHLIQLDGADLNTLEPYYTSYYHSDEKNGWGWGGTNQTRFMEATRENVDAGDGSGVKEWYVVRMPVDTPVPDGLVHNETFTNDESRGLYITSLLTDGVYCRIVDGVTCFYLPVDNTPDTFSYLYNINQMCNKNQGTGEDMDIFDGETADALLEVIITPYLPDAIFLQGGEYRSTFLPEKLLNTYMNTIKLTGHFDQGELTFDGQVYTITRTKGDDNTAQDIATVTLSHDGTCYRYNVTYPDGSWATNTAQENRWDSEAVTLSGKVDDGINIRDYFAASTANGGDTSGKYIYTIKEDVKTNRFVVPVYAASANIHLVSDIDEWRSNPEKPGYTLEEINSADEDRHMLKTPVGISASHSEFYNSQFKYHSLYRNNWLVEKFIIGVNNTDKLPYYQELDGEDDMKYAYGMHVVSRFGENSYGTNEVDIPVASVEISAHDLAKTAMTFNNGSRYYSCLAELVFSQSRPGLSTQSGGYRVWRDCPDSDEAFEEFKGRATDFMFFKSMGLEEHCDMVHNVGSEVIKGTNTTGTFGAKSESPTVTYRARAYYKVEPGTAKANGMKRAAARAAAGTTDYYHVAEHVIEVTWPYGLVTAIDGIDVGNEIANVRYYNMTGQSSSKPFSGVNVVVTTFKDGSTVTTKILK